FTGTFSMSADCNMDCQTCCLIDCNKGHYYTAGNCLECPVGFYCPGGRAAPRKCPVGTANQLTAQADITACQACPDGYISSETRSGCRLCPDGYLCDPHSGFQKSCNPGQYSPEGELECWECPQGYVCPDGRNRQHCSAGQEPNPSRTHCVTCTLGSFSTKEALGCQPCPAVATKGSSQDWAASMLGAVCAHNKRDSLEGIIVLTLVPSSLSLAHLVPALMPLGRASAKSAMKAPAVWILWVRSNRTVNPLNHQKTCNVRHAHQVTFVLMDLQLLRAQQGASSPESSSTDPATAPHACQVASVKSPLLLNLCQGTGWKALWDPRRGMHSGIRQCLKCPTGYFCPAGARYPRPCRAGTYNPLRGQDDATDCRACPAGRVCTQAGLTQPDSECMAGFMCVRWGLPGLMLLATRARQAHSATISTFLISLSVKHVLPDSSVREEQGGSRSPLSHVQLVTTAPQAQNIQHNTSVPQAPGAIGQAWHQRRSVCPVLKAGFVWQELVCRQGDATLDITAQMVHGQAPSSPVLREPTVSDWEMAEWKTALPALWDRTAQMGPPSQLFAQRQGLLSSITGGTFPTSCGYEELIARSKEQRWLETASPAPEDTTALSLALWLPKHVVLAAFQGMMGRRLLCSAPAPGGIAMESNAHLTVEGDPGSASCLSCLTGHYCADEITSREAMLLVMVCPEGLLCPEGQAVTPDASGNACPRGYYCPRGDIDSHSRPCPNGTYSEQKGLGRADECLLCPAGKYCYREWREPRGIPHPTGDCPPGYTCPPGTGFPFSFPCLPGFYWDSSAVERGNACEPCPAGYYCDSPAMTQPKTCPAGSYCARGSSRPEPCPEGTYGNRKELAAPLDCSPCGGLPTDGVTGDTCPVGAYCPPGSLLPTPCPPGTYSNVSGLKSLKQCLDCPPGLYCDGTNSQAPTGPCKPGYFCTGAAKTALQHVAMEGHYSLAGAFRPEPCPLGSFQPVLGQSLCRECPEGTFCNQTGLAEPVTCSKGHYCPARSILPLPCPAGTYMDILGAMGTGSCKPCPAGMYCSTAGLATPEGLCQPGYYCAQGSNSTSPVGLPFGDLCLAGYYCPAGTKHPREMPCPAGTWNERRGAQDASWCLPCPPGFFCSMAGQVSPAGLCAPGYYCTGGTQTPRPLDAVTGDLCPKGHFCLAGSAAPSPCPDGEYSNATGIKTSQDKCFPCPAGFHCQHGIMQHCPPGFYCPQKTGISFYPCPAGTYNPSHGISQAERCQQCPAAGGCFVENGDYPLRVAPAGQDSSAQQEPVSQTLMEPQIQALEARAHLGIFAQPAPASHFHALWAHSRT
ncbi:unnamed protein product, partial [Eretmochelys imbricata]